MAHGELTIAGPGPDGGVGEALIVALGLADARWVQPHLPHGVGHGFVGIASYGFRRSGFDAPDEQPVNLLIFLLVPEASTQKHLEILSEIAEMLSDAVLRDKLKSCTDAVQLHQLIASWHSLQAA